jgi:hypothetical protein
VRQVTAARGSEPKQPEAIEPERLHKVSDDLDRKVGFTDFEGMDAVWGLEQILSLAMRNPQGFDVLLKYIKDAANMHLKQQNLFGYQWDDHVIAKHCLGISGMTM